MRPNAWKPDSPQSRLSWWLVYRFMPAAVLASALGLFFYLVAQPLFHPRVYMFFAAAHYRDGRLDCSSPVEDLAAVHVAPIALLRDSNAKEAEFEPALSTPAAMAAALDHVQRGAVRDGDVLIVWLAGELVSREGQLDLVCENFNPSDLQSSCLPLVQVLDRVRASRAATKLIVLDTGRVSHFPRLGTVADVTSDQIEQLIGRERDTSLWVMLAHRELEKSHVLAGSRRSVLAHFSSEALQGAADANGDRYVDVSEFYRYVRDHVSDFVEQETRGRDAQTPRLLWGGGDWFTKTSFPRLLPVKLPAQDEAAETGSSEVAKEGEAKEGEKNEAEKKEGEKKEEKSVKESKPVEKPHLSPPPAALLDLRAPSAKIDSDAGLPMDDKKPGAESASGAKTNPNGEAALGKPAAGDAVLTASPIELAAMAWSVHDRLAASARLRPVSTAPHLWRAFEDVLVAHEFALQSGDTLRLSALTPELRRLVRQATDLADGRAPERFRPRDILPDLALASAPDGDDLPAHSLAMAQQLLLRGGSARPRDLTAAAEQLDRAISRPDKAAFQKAVKDFPSQLDAWVEFRLAHNLAARDDLTLDQIKLVLAASRTAENVAAATLDAGDWSRLSIERADALRQRGQQFVLEPVRPGDTEVGMTMLREALAEYQKAAAWSEDAVALEQSIDVALFDLPDYLRWSITSLADPLGRDSQGELLERLLTELRQAIEIADSSSPAKLPDVRRMRLQLEDTLAKLRQSADRSLGLPPAVAPAPGSAPPHAGLAASDARRRLLALAIAMPPPDAVTSHLSAVIEVRDPARRLQPAVARFAEAASLFGIALRTSRDDKHETNHDASNFSATQRFGESVRDALQALPREIQRETADNLDLSDPSRRPARLRRLQAARRLLYLVSPWDAEHLEGFTPALPMRRAQLYDLFVWQQQRLTAEATAAAPVRRRDLLEMAEIYGRAAAEIPQQPPVVAPPQSRATLAAVAQIDLADKAEKDVVLTIANGDEKRQAIWLTAAYDPAVLELSAPEDNRTQIYDDSAFQHPRGEVAGPMSVPLADPKQLISQSSAYLQLDRAAVTARAPSCVLAAGESHPAWIRLRRKTLAGGDARVIVHAISLPQDVAARSANSTPEIVPMSVRHDLLVQLPRRLSIDLVADGIVDTWQPSESGLLLYPFPNHSTAFRFSLINTGAVEREVSLDIYRTETPTASSPPRGDVPAAIADEYLSRVGGVLLTHVDKITLPASGERVAVPFPPPGEPAKSPASAPGGKPAAASTEPPPPPALSPVLAVVIADRASNRRAVKTIEILTQRPARYLHSRAEYDPLRRRLDISFRPVKPGSLPAEGVHIVAAPQAQETEELYHADAVLHSGAAEATLHVEVPRDMTEIYPVVVTVDGFARAFRYEVATRAQSTATVPEVSRAGIRIVNPKAGKLYGPPTSDVPVDLEVDVPHGLLLDSSNCVEVGIDTNRDRLLEHEETTRLTSDRQVDLVAEEIGPQGRFVIGTKVKDLKVKLQPPTLRALRANLLARILMPAAVIWSEPLEVIFDDRPPQMSQLQLEPGETVTEGDDLLVSVLAGDNDLSGVAKVEAAFDLQRKGEFGTPPPVAGTMQTNGRWVVTLPTKPLRPGMYTVLLRATDRCDNTSDYLKATIEVVPKSTAVEHAKPQLGQINGRVVYGRFEKQPVAKALVQLTAGAATGTVAATGALPRETTTDDNGVFRFSDVPPGDYKLASEKLLGGNRRVAHADVKVPAPPQATPAVDLTLETAR